MSINRWMDKGHMAYRYIEIHTMEYNSVIKQNEIMPYAATWTDLEMIIPSQRKAKPLRITYEWNLRNSTNECIY